MVFDVLWSVINLVLWIAIIVLVIRGIRFVKEYAKKIDFICDYIEKEKNKRD